MKGLFSVLSAVLALSCSAPLVMAADSAPVVKPSGTDRGLYGDDLGAPAAAPAAITITKIPLVKPAAKPNRVAPVGAGRTGAGKTVTGNKMQSTGSNGSKQANVTMQAVPINNSQLVPVSQITPVSGGAVVTAWLNKPGASPKYKVGEKMQINITASSDCNVVVLDYDGHGKLTQIFPNEYQSNGFVKAGESVAIGGPDSPFDYQVGGRGGAEKIFVYAYPQSSENPLTVAMAPAENSPFRSAEMTIEQYRDLVNKSKVFFSREVKIVPKNGAKPVSMPSPPANKIELTFEVDAK
jgi:hypothetical protein